MENASKALIIAGAILLAILIIALGIMIYNQASGVVNTDAMTEVEISTFNNKFTQYLGDNVRGAQVKALVQAVDQNNRANADDDSRQIQLECATNIKTGKTYKVEETGKTTGGLIHNIKVTENQ